MKRKTAFALIIIVFLLLVACGAPGNNPYKNSPGNNGKVAGYWYGLWHAVILPYTFIGSWFTDNVNIYEVHNNGLWYHIGFFTPGFIFILIGWSQAYKMGFKPFDDFFRI